MLRNRYVRVVMLSRILQQLGIWIRNFAILLYVTDLTHNDSRYVSLISVVEYAPILVFSFIGGTFADRWRPKLTMVWCDLLSAISVGLVLAALSQSSWYVLLAGTFVSACISQFSQPSAMKLYKNHVPGEMLQSVMALSQSLVAVFMVLGPMAGAFIFQQYGIVTSLVITGILFGGSSLVLILLPKDLEQSSSGTVSNFKEEMKAGLRYMWSNRSLRVLSWTFAVVGLAAGLTQPLALFVVTEKLGLHKEFLQWPLMANGAAMLVGGGVVMTLTNKVRPQTLLAAGLVISALTTALIGASTIIAFSMMLMVINGLFYPCIQIGIQTLIIKNTEAAYIGRVGGAITPVFSGMMVMGMFVSGYFKETTSLLTVYMTSGILLLLGTIILIPLWHNRPEVSLEAGVR
ncbi:MFS transporter [Paenibacillus sp. YPG26]|uniref:MFS transporter n=1 Tax=Paenibacillus sp. YPG26 TaxID=2878915 RepID=UPI00203D8881|nr:MFS transporter [Paenibacillus sp. YPG26]USB35077.1 MFS transporter [Paenibacillus sp. YPG26]